VNSWRNGDAYFKSTHTFDRIILKKVTSTLLVFSNGATTAPSFGKHHYYIRFASISAAG
jgi:hypothetical protein